MSYVMASEASRAPPSTRRLTLSAMQTGADVKLWVARSVVSVG